MSTKQSKTVPFVQKKKKKLEFHLRHVCAPDNSSVVKFIYFPRVCCEADTCLEFTVYPELGSNLRQSSHLNLLISGIIGSSHDV